MSKEWAGKTVLGLAIYMILFVLTVSYAGEVANYFEFTLQGNATKDVDLELSLGSEYSCGYPRYKYATTGESSKYVFDKDNLDCEVSAGAISPKTCDFFEGCTWKNETSGFLWFKDVTGICEGDLNKTFYNDGVYTEEKICDVVGLQGNENTLTCSQLGCTVYEPRNLGEVSGISSTADVMGTLGNLFSFKYDFGFERSIFNFLANFTFFYLELIVLVIALYILSPLSN